MQKINSMLQLRTYANINDYLAENQAILEQRELENNLILGICNSFPDKNVQMPDCHFLSVFDKDEFKATAIKTLPKAFLSSTSKNAEDLKPLANYFTDNKLKIAGVVGETFYANAFTNYLTRDKVSDRKLLVHKLTQVNTCTLANGEFKPARMEALDYLAEWANQFQHDAHAFPKKTKAEIRSNIKHLISKNNLFNWFNERNELVSMAGMIRSTSNIGIVGLVYTPKHFRGKGYAKSCVQKLSEHILTIGHKHCGLFTESANPTSNKIYKEIGYEVFAEFSDIAFS